MSATALLGALDRLLEADARGARDRALAPIRTKLEAAASKHFTRQGTLFLTRFARFKSQFAEAQQEDWEDAYGAVADSTAADLAAAIDTAAAAAFQAGADAAHGALSIAGSFDLSNPRAVAYLDGYGAAQVTRIDETTRAQLRTLIGQAVDEGWSYGQLAREIRARFDGMSRDRALVIATYETGMAYEAGNAAAVAELHDAGVAMEKSWLTASDNRVDPHCQANRGAGWIPFTQAFPSGHDQPLSHPRCRCTALYRRKKGQAA